MTDEIKVSAAMVEAGRYAEEHFKEDTDDVSFEEWCRLRISAAYQAMEQARRDETIALIKTYGEDREAIDKERDKPCVKCGGFVDDEPYCLGCVL